MSQATIRLEELVSEVRAGAPGAADEVITEYLGKSAREFCRRTAAWRTACAPVTIKAAEAEYPFTFPPETLPLRPVEANYQAPTATVPRPIGIVTDDQLRDGGGGGYSVDTFGFLGGGVDWRTRTGSPRAVYHDENNLRIRLFPIPTTTDAGGMLRLWFSLLPQRGVEELPEWMADRYFEALADGAKALLLMIPKRNWSDATRGEFHQERFNKAVLAAQVERAQGFTNAPLTVQPRTHIHGLP